MDRFDELGRTMFCAEVEIILDPNTKMGKQVCTDVTAELQKPEEEEGRIEGDNGGTNTTKLKIDECTREIGGLILRGNRAVLCRSIKKKWNGMTVPSVRCNEDESEIDCAIRSVTQFCEIDGKTEEKLEIAKKMLAKGKNAEEIAELTGLSLEKVNSLRKRPF